MPQQIISLDMCFSTPAAMAATPSSGQVKKKSPTSGKHKKKNRVGYKLDPRKSIFFQDHGDGKR